MSSPAAIHRSERDDHERVLNPPTPIPVTTCPACLKTFDGLTCTWAEALMPGAGLICCRCGSLLQITADGLVVVSDEDWR